MGWAFYLHYVAYPRFTPKKVLASHFRGEEIGYLAPSHTANKLPGFKLRSP